MMVRRKQLDRCDVPLKTRLQYLPRSVVVQMNSK